MMTSKSRRFSLASAMIVVGATAPGLLLLRLGSSLDIFSPSGNAAPGQER
jgi:hypothetical protein